MDFCTCKKEASGVLPLAMAIVPIQPWEPPCEPEKALCQGTVFPSLNMPFYVTEEGKAGGFHG